MTWDKVRARLLALWKRPDPKEDEAALAAKMQNSNKGKTSASSDKHCLIHGQNTSHTTDQCHQMKAFASDGGGEFTSHQMEAEFKRLGIIHETTAPYTPEQDGVAERMNETLVTRATTILIDSRLPRKFWNFALSAAAYTINRTPTSSQNFRIPHKKLFDRPVNVHHMHQFGCRAYPLIPKEKRHKQKFGNKAERCVFIRYHEVQSTRTEHMVQS